MTGRIKVVEVELGDPPVPLGDLEGYCRIWALVRLHGTPIGRVEIPIPEGSFAAQDLRRAALRRLEWPIISHKLSERYRLSSAVEDPLPLEGPGTESVTDALDSVPKEELPYITVAVCTRDRTGDLKTCLDALVRLEYPHLDILVVDNAPSSDATEQLVEQYPRVRYVRELEPGLSRARNRAIAEARGEIIAFTDDDVVADPGWVLGLSRAFRDPEVMGVTGLIAPYELETEAQVLFERHRGFGRGYRSMHWRMDLEGGEHPLRYLGTGRYGTGANMAYRREVFRHIGTFDPALGVGTPTNGGEDLDMFFRVLRGGHALAYEPSALVRHRHRREYAQLRKQLTDNASSVSSTLVRTAQAYPELRQDATKFWLWWFWRGHLRRLVKSLVHRESFPRDLILAELKGFLIGLVRYQEARRHADRVSLGDGTALEAPRLDSEVEGG